MDVIIAVGLNDKDTGEALSPGLQRMLRQIVRNSVDAASGTVNAEIVGFSDGGDYDPEPGVWFAATIPDYRLPLLREFLAGDARLGNQESIGLTSPDGFEFVYAAQHAF